MGSISSTKSTFLEKYRVKIFVALLITFVAGFVDIIGYLGIYRLFTAHMTGATVQLGRDAVLGNWNNVFAAMTVIASFFAGSVFGRAVIQIGSRRGMPRVASITLILEAALILCVAYWVTNGTIKTHLTSDSLRENLVLLSALATAMGLQTATLTGIGPLTIHTTFVTGMLNKLAQFATRISFRAFDIFVSPSVSNATRLIQSEEMREAFFVLMIWIFYVNGAAAGTWLYNLWGIRSLRLASSLLFVGVVIDLVHPLSVQEEKEQSEHS